MVDITGQRDGHLQHTDAWRLPHRHLVGQARSVQATNAQPLVPVLSDGVVTLRGFVQADTDAVVAYAADPEVQRWTALPQPYTRRDAESFLANGADAWRRGHDRSFAIETQGRWAGALDLRPVPGKAAEVGFGLAPWARGQGVMTRALRLSLAWAFAALGVDLVQWEAHVGNWASRRAAWATGFRIDGELQSFLEVRGARINAWYGVLRRDDPMRPAHPWLDAVQLHGSGIVLRAHTEDDLPRMTEAASDPLTQHWLTQLPAPYTLDDARRHLLMLRSEAAAGRRVTWAVADPHDGRMLGEIGVFMRDDSGSQNEVGYWTHPDARGRGLMSQAARMVARHALLPAEEGGLGFARVFLRASEGNLASRKIAENAGFRQVGVDRAADVLGDGTIADSIRYDLLPSELPAVR
jgi:RimJ/RimL family protein N-acetyltransferase